ncbi:ATP-binding protein [Pedobacter sp. L105]|uniref:ATP-binding protein n=1 Tax=Pedobacter sp. L105 TaxID=1641871 RepID=UPI00131E6778|nr:ATP-binding protein [Pedobacter sp. L105]
MLSFEDIFFKALFNSPVPRVILKADAPDFTIINFNDAYKEVTNTKHKDITGLFLWQAFDPKDAGDNGGEILLTALVKATETNQTVHMPPFHYDIPAADGTGIVLSWWQLEIVPVTGNDGKPEYLLLTTNNITEEILKQQSIEEAKVREHHLNEEILTINEELMTANEELLTSNEDLLEAQEKLTLLNKELEQRVVRRTRELVASNLKLKNIFEQSPLGFYVLTGPDLIIDLVNDHMLKLWNKSRDIIGKPYILVRPEANSFINTLKEVYRSGNPFKENELKVPIYEGEVLTHGYFNIIYQPIKNEQNLTTGILAIIEDVTERILSKQNIDRINRQLHLAVNAAKMGSWNIDPETKALHYNTMLAELYGYEGPGLMTYADAIGQVTEDYRDQLLDQIEEAISHGGDYDITYTQRRFDNNELIWLRSMGKVTPDSHGDYTVFSGVVMDITEQVKAGQLLEQGAKEQQLLNDQLAAINEKMTGVNEQLYQTQEDLVKTLSEVAESEARLRYLLEDAPIAIAVMKGRELVIEAANKKILEIWGKSSKIIGQPLHLALPELQGQDFLAWMDKVYITGEPFIGTEVMAFLEVKGTLEEVYSNFVYHPIKGPDGQTNSIMVVVNVVTEEVKAKQRIETAQQQFRQAIDSANLGTWSVDPERSHLTLSERSKQLFGVPLDKEVSFSEAMEAVDPDYHELIHTTVTKGLVLYESCDIEYPINSLVSKQRKWLRVTGKMFFDDGNKPAHFSGIIMDITDRKLEEQRKDDFISVASHELKTPITTLKGSIQLLRRMKDRAPKEVLSDLIEQANKSMDKVNGLIDNFLNVNLLSDGQIPLNKKTFTVSEMLDGCCNHVRSAGHYELILEGDRELQVFADQDRIDQVVVNFVNNAVKYAPLSTKIYLIIEKFGQMVKISVKDTGPGIPPEKVGHLFGRYYRADYSGFQYSGLGLGLYISAEIIKRHDGEIGVDSELGKGSTFWFTLPL